MRAIVTMPFDGKPDDAPLPRSHVAGEEIAGARAEAAVAQGWAVPIEPDGAAPSIPEGWRELDWKALRRLAIDVAGAPPNATKAQAVEIIEGEIARREAAVG